MIYSASSFRPVMARLVVALLVLAAPASFAGNDPVRITVGSGGVNPGNDVEISVHLDSGNTAPQSLILFLRYDTSRLAYDPDYYQFVTQDIFGAPAVGSDGQPLFTRSGVRPGEVTTSAQKLVDVQEHPSGALGIAVFGLNSTSIQDGLLLTVALKLLPGVDDALRLDLEGVDRSDPIEPVLIGGGTASFSSASFVSGNQEVNLDVRFTDGFVFTACGPASSTPQNVSASTTRTDGVLVTWDAVAGASTEYRVYSALSDNPAQALPLGDAWGTGNSFLDTTARFPATLLPRGCMRGDLEAANRQYYWVKARNAQDCESEFQGQSASGYRASAKAVRDEANVVLNSFGVTAFLVLALVFGHLRTRRRVCAAAVARRTLPRNS